MTPNTMEWHVYILELRNRMLYVGISTDPKRRYIQHCEGKGSVWTRMHQPIRIMEIASTGVRSKRKAEHLESKRTLELIDTYGWQRVRGGRFVKVDEKFHLCSLANHDERFRSLPEVGLWLERTDAGFFRCPYIVAAMSANHGAIFRTWDQASRFIEGAPTSSWRAFHKDDLAAAYRWIRESERFPSSGVRVIARSAVLVGRASSRLKSIAGPEWEIAAAIFGGQKYRTPVVTVKESPSQRRIRRNTDVPDWMRPLTNRAINVLKREGLVDRKNAVAAILSGALSLKTKGLGEKTMLEICAALEVVPSSSV